MLSDRSPPDGEEEEKMKHQTMVTIYRIAATSAAAFFTLLVIAAIMSVWALSVTFLVATLTSLGFMEAMSRKEKVYNQTHDLV